MKPRKAVIVISSHVVRGSVGNRAAVFALETLGFPVWAVPTILLPWHPGHGSASRIVPDTNQFARLLGDLENAPWLDEVGAVLSGYLGDPGQAAAIAGLVRSVRKKNPGAIYVCDPVIGDSGGLYVDEMIAGAICNLLLPIADIATPNRFELEWIFGRKFADTRSIITAVRNGPAKSALVTSILSENGDHTGNLLITSVESWHATHPVIPDPPNGPGDLTSALYLGRHLEGFRAPEALRLTTSAVYEVLAATKNLGADELQLEANSGVLLNPAVDIRLVQLD